LHVYDAMAMGQDNVFMFKQCFKINESKFHGKKDRRNGTRGFF
jgi:hypothetical protein